MKLTTHSIASFLLLLVAVFVVVVADERDFSEISNIPQDVNAVHLPAKCPKFGRVTKIMYTFEPSSNDDEDDEGSVKIFTYPANLLTATKKDNDELHLELNMDVANAAKEGGVKIYFPSSQLHSVSVSADANAQIMNGFTNIHSLSVSSDAKLWATMTSLNNSTTNSSSTKLSLKMSSDSNAAIISNKAVGSLLVSSDAQVSVEAPTVDDVSVTSDADLKLKANTVKYAKVTSDGTFTLDGDLDSGKLTSDAKTTVYGKVTGSVEVRSDAKLYVGEGISDTASIEARSDGRVRAPSCDRVNTKSDAKCSIDNGISGNVVVVVEEKPLTRTGTTRCGGGGFGDCEFSGAWFAIFGIAIFIGSTYGIYRCCCRRNNKQRTNNSKNNKVQVAEAYAIDDDDDAQGKKDNKKDEVAEKIAIAEKVGDADNTGKTSGSIV